MLAGKDSQVAEMNENKALMTAFFSSVASVLRWFS
jgi:hypothetical protein